MNYIVTYKDTQTQSVEAHEFKMASQWVIFISGGRTVLAIASDAVQSVRAEGVAAAQRAPMAM